MTRHPTDDPPRGDASPTRTVGTTATAAGPVTSDDDGDGDDLRLRTGDAVGRYVVLEQLAAGGMGVIYSAYDPELDRRLALKLLRSRSAATDDKSPRARLVREAQALARVTHPHVVTVHDVGLHGVDVFVAMELVEGGTLKTWWKDQKRSWSEVLELLLRAGEGLQAAHEQGVVHRDFKPDNVLIGQDGRVAVADFGLARAADASIEPKSQPPSVDGSVSRTTGDRVIDMSVELTRTGVVLGTPAYMAPEQHRGRAGDIRADIFSFCVTAYEAFYGVRPFEGETVAVVAGNVLRGAVRPPPVDRWIPPRVHQALLSGLALDPRKRPQSMAVLLEQLRPPSRRPSRRWVVVGAGLLAVAATAAGGYALGTSRPEPCSPAVERFTGVWDPARRQALADAFAATGRPFADDLRERTEASLDHIVERWTAQAQAICEATHVHRTQSAALLDIRMACLDRRADDLRIAVGTLEDGDAELLSHSLDVVRGIPDLSVCAEVDVLDSAVRLDDPEDRAVAEEIQQQLAIARTLHDGGHTQEALPRAKQVVDQARALGSARLVAEALYLSSEIHQTLDQRSMARVELEEATSAAIAAGDERLAATLAIAAVYAVGYTLSDFAGAEGWDRLAQAWLARIGTPDPLEAQRLDNRGVVYTEAGRADDALVDLKQAQALYARSLSADHPSVANNLVHIADVYIAQGRYDDAVKIHREALALYEAIYGPAHPSLLPSINNLGVALKDLNRLDEAEQLFQRALVLAQAALGPQSRYAALALRNLSGIELSRGRYEQAIDMARRALAIYQSTSETVDKAKASALGWLAVTLASAKQFEEATEYFRQAHAAQVELLGPDDISTVFAENNLGTVLADQGRHDEGLLHLRSALAAKERLLGTENPKLVSTLGAIGESLRTKGQPGDALPYFERAESIGRKAFGDTHPSVLDALTGQGGCHLDLGQVDTAKTLLERALEISGQITVEPLRLGVTRLLFARALDRGGESERARELAQQVLTVAEEAGEPGAKLRAEITEWMEG